jgi:hypothetical protein
MNIIEQYVQKGYISRQLHDESLEMYLIIDWLETKGISVNPVTGWKNGSFFWECWVWDQWSDDYLTIKGKSEPREYKNKYVAIREGLKEAIKLL